jgi:hypothetical protein
VAAYFLTAWFLLDLRRDHCSMIEREGRFESCRGIVETHRGRMLSLSVLVDEEHHDGGADFEQRGTYDDAPKHEGVDAVRGIAHAVATSHH